MLISVFCSRICITCIRHTHPAKHQSSSVMHETLWCIEVKTEVRLLILCYKTVGSEIPLYNKVSAGVNILEFILSSLKSLWTCHKDPLTVYFKEIRTFPHISYFCHGFKGTDMLPVIEILRFKNQHLSLIFHGSGTYHHIVFALVFKYLGISYMQRQSFRIILIVHNDLHGFYIYSV